MQKRKSNIYPLLGLLGLLVLIAGYLYSTGWWENAKTAVLSANTAEVTQKPKTYAIDDLGTDRYPERVVDTEHRIGIYVDKLKLWTTQIEKNLGIEIQFIVTRLPESDMGIQAAKLFELRRIGQHALTGGILILVDPYQAKAKIEVSYQLEGIFTDSVAGQIVKQQLVPYASYQVMGMALMDTLKYIQDYIYLAAIQGKIQIDPRFRSTQEYLAKQKLYSGGAGGFANLSDFSIDRDFKRALTAKQSENYRPSSDPRQSAEALIRVYRDLIGDPNLALFSAASRIQRSVYPVAPFEFLTHYRALEKSRPFELATKGDFAVLTSSHPAYGFFPIMLKKEAGLWRVDLVEIWKNMFFNRQAKYWLRNSNMPYKFGLPQYGDPLAYDVQALPVPSEKLTAIMANLEKQNTAVAHFKLAELHFRNAFTALEALKHYEIAIRMAPNYPRFAEVLADRYVYLYFPQAAIPLLKQQGRVALLKLAEAYGQMEDYEKVEAVAREVLASNPYSSYGLQWLVWSLGKQGKQKQMHEYQQQLRDLLKDPQQKFRLVWLTFTPEHPRFNTDSTVKVHGTTVYGHSEFAVTMTNLSNRDVEIKSLVFVSRGDKQVSGLGDIKDYFRYPRSKYILGLQESVTYEKVWGFTVPVRDQHMTYDFELCWQGLKDSIKQCEVQRLHLVSEDSYDTP